MSNPNLLVVLGATATGKTQLAVHLASVFGGEIISADSRQVFRGMDIGTGKDLNEYRVDGKQIRHHLIDIREAGERYQVNAFKEDFYAAFEQINQRANFPILCGGTGMYIHSLLQNHELTAIPVNLHLREELMLLSKEELQDRIGQFPLALRSHVDYSSAKRLIRAIEVADYLSKNEVENVPRPVLSPLVIGLYNDVETRRFKIAERLKLRLNNGLVEEVEKLIANGVSKEMLNFYGLEYKFVVSYLNGEVDFATMNERLQTAIFQFAKRQMTFFRKMEKDGVTIVWLEAKNDKAVMHQQAVELVGRFLNKNVEHV
ncbi:tRNA (adenosine(37)-N6)-dimethylallyltransferase MiaA [Nubsella zeaxanthinifaciens]|jgi:tRNA dimethylallyltransferase|uniref:tRNA (adenosine(37)-N6)-dimethylallyltransferase MiaA n=1 Tax=Nubsella zeaxanthinifaciens TaxID=392412 RepID=UPI000DE41EC5|nr:tRNA (adenosine(37)-N6)-dimethylallyltransferase MiaA [Nubsella zeaxanthinifaciens]